MKVKEEGKILEIKGDRMILGIQEVFTKALLGLTPKVKEKEEVYKGMILT